MEEHFSKLIHMYMGAEIQNKYPGIHLEIEKGSAKITLPVDNSYHHAGGSMHGSVYFRLLDDVCYFAAMSEEMTYFYVTKSFTIQFFRPFYTGLVTAKTTDIKFSGNTFHAKGTLYDEEGNKLAIGEGVFSKSTYKLDPKIGYRLD
jgi:uncharacterized protein (TIGR00369 family)